MEKKLLRTIRALLKAPESVLEILWKYSVAYTLLINKLFQQIPQEPDFPEWQAKGAIEQAAVDRLIAPWKKQEPFAGMPQRWYASAGYLVTDCYKAWFAQHSKTIWSLRGSQRWLAALLLYSESMRLHEFSESQFLKTAQRVLNAARQEVLAAIASRPETDPESALFNTLLKRHEKASNALTQCAIVYLVQRRYVVGEPMLEPDELQTAIAIKQKEIENLEQQLKARYPKGRDPLGDRFEAEIDAAIAGPVLSGGSEAYQADLERWWIRRQIDPRLKTPDLQVEGDAEVDQRELEKWSKQQQIRLFEETPYPLMFRTGTDLHWSKEPIVRQARSAGTSQSESRPEPVPSTRPKKRRSKRQKRRRVPQERIYVSFHSMTKYQFQLFCGHRQLGDFKQIVDDHCTRAALEEQKFDAACLLLRSAALVWEKDDSLERQHQKRIKRQSNGEGSDEVIPPWLTHRLSLHCAIDDELKTVEGAENALQEKINPTIKTLKTLKKKQRKLLTLAESEAHSKAEADVQSLSPKVPKTNHKKGQKAPPKTEEKTIEQQLKDQQSRIAATKTTLRYLHQLPPNRPHKPTHQRQDHLTMGISFGRKDPIALVVIDSRNDSVVFECSTETLLNIANKDSTHRQIIQLHKQHQAIVKKRSQRQKRGRYEEHSSEANAREYTARVIASAIVEVAIELQVGMIVLPNLEGIRERVEAMIRVEAEMAHPHHVEAQNQYCKDIRESYHRWNYGQLATAIQRRAAKSEFPIRFVFQPVAESLLAIAAAMARSTEQNQDQSA